MRWSGDAQLATAMLVASLVVGVGCPVAVPAPMELNFACKTDTECSPGFHCEGRRCVEVLSDAGQATRDRGHLDANSVEREEAGAVDSSTADTGRPDGAGGEVGAEDAAPIDATLADNSDFDVSLGDSAADAGSQVDAGGDASSTADATPDAIVLDVAVEDHRAYDSSVADAAAPDTATIDAALAEWPAGYAYRKAITIHASQVAANLDNFPVMIWLDDDSDLDLRV